MNCHSRLHDNGFRPWLGDEHTLQFDASYHRVGDSWEDRDEPIASGREHDSVASLDRFHHQLVMTGHSDVHQVGMGLPLLRRSLEVREEERDSPHRH
jgi:hypothetical protein